MKKIIILLFLSHCFFIACSQDTTLIENLLLQNKNLFDTVMSNPQKYELQIIYTQIDRDKNNKPSFTQHQYRVDKSQYFYPASSIKFPVAVLALQKINELNIKGLTKNTRIRIDSGYKDQTRVLFDSSSFNMRPSIAHYIKKLFITSDNDAYNRLYEFIGQRYLNETLHKMGYKDVRIVHRLAVGDGAERAKYTNPMSFFQNGKLVYQQPLMFNDTTYSFQLTNEIKGKGFMRKDKLVNEPMNFTANNYMSLENQHEMLKAVMFPDDVPANMRFDLTHDDYKLLYRSMSMLPRESDYPNYKSDTTIHDNQVKFLMYATTPNIKNKHIRIFNKIGLAYGYLIDNAYIVDFEKKIEFLLSAVIYVNEDQIFNDDKYEYDSIGFPFLANLGKIFYEYELKRERRHKPILHRFKVID
jgi:hypothetical protein